jgi:hypothetical protein
MRNKPKKMLLMTEEQMKKRALENQLLGKQRLSGKEFKGRLMRYRLVSADLKHSAKQCNALASAQ